MPDDFLFDVGLSNEARFDEMVRDLAASILGHVGCPGAAAGETLALVRAELARGAAEGLHGCRVRFRKRPGALEIVVSYTGGREWRTKRTLL